MKLFQISVTVRQNKPDGICITTVNGTTVCDNATEAKGRAVQAAHKAYPTAAILSFDAIDITYEARAFVRDHPE